MTIHVQKRASGYYVCYKFSGERTCVDVFGPYDSKAEADAKATALRRSPTAG